MKRKANREVEPIGNISNIEQWNKNRSSNNGDFQEKLKIRMEQKLREQRLKENTDANQEEKDQDRK